jgi:hypothetical protein
MILTNTLNDLAKSPTRPRRWLRFSLRSLLVLVTVLCVWLGVKVNQARRQKEAVAALQELGATVTYAQHRVGPNAFNHDRELDVPGWLRELAGDDFFQSVISLNVGQPMSDAELVHLSALPEIEYMDLERAGRGVTDAGLAHLPRPDRLVSFCGKSTSVGDEFVKRLEDAVGLETFDLSGTRVTDEGLRSLRGLKKLIWLYLADTNVGDAGLEALQESHSLETLDLNGTKVTDAGLVHLSKLPWLWKISLNNTRISDAGLKSLASLRRLGTIELAGTRVGGPGLAHIAPLLDTMLDLTDTSINDASLQYLRNAKHLRGLFLEGTPITDEGLVHLQYLPKLKGVSLAGTKVTKAGIARLAKLRPGLQICSEPGGRDNGQYRDASGAIS